jgi:hypothetical protein
MAPGLALLQQKELNNNFNSSAAMAFTFNQALHISHLNPEERQAAFLLDGQTAGLLE